MDWFIAGKDPFRHIRRGGTLTLKGYVREVMIAVVEEEREHDVM